MISNKDVKFYITADIIDEEAESEIAQNALISIAKEIQRFQYEEEKLQQNRNHGDDICDKLNIYRIKAKFQDKQLRKLKGNLRIACIVAKIIMAAKVRKIDLLVNHVNIIEDESAQLLKSLTLKMDLIEQLHTDNATVCGDMQQMNNFIHLGYKEVQKMRKQIPKDIPHIVELKEILLACGQYYADYCNEHERCTQLERQNRFLKNKLSILENNLVATNEELHNLRNQNIRLTRTLDAKQVDTQVVPKIQLDQNMEKEKWSQNDRFGLTPRSVNENCPRVVPLVSTTKLDMASHLSTVSSLLFAQESMLQDLKKISEQLCTSQ